MSRLEEHLNDQFRRWESRGRGWHVFPDPVHPEPPFAPFDGYCFPTEPAADDGRRATFLSSLVQSIGRAVYGEPPSPPAVVHFDEPAPTPLVRDSLVELQTSLPADLDIPRDAFGQFLLNLSLCQEPVGFELLGLPNRVTAQFVAHPSDAPIVRRQLQAHFPDAAFQPRQHMLAQAWESCEGDDVLIVEFGLAREFMFALATRKLDPFVGIIGALAELQPGELGLFQVLFQSVQHPWAESIRRSVNGNDDKPIFENIPELIDAAEAKIARPLYAAVVRIALRTGHEARTLQLAQDLAGSLRVFADPQGNELIPLSNNGYPLEAHVEDLIRRQSRRSGMLLNSEELIGFVHVPSSDVRSAVLLRDSGKTRLAPAVARQATGILLGTNTHLDESHPVRLTASQRVQHMHVIGASGTGKSTLLFNLIRQDIEHGEGVGVLDPHGDLVERILGIIPPERVDDVILVDPSDKQYSVGFNILSAHSDLEKNLLASDLVAIFERLSTSWGDQMGSVLQNAFRAFLESDEKATLSDVRRFLIEPPFRDRFLQTVRDADIVYYWRKAFPQLSGNKSIGPVVTRLNTLLGPKPVRHMVSQAENRLDFTSILDTGKIFLAKLPEGQIGQENAYLIGSLLVAKFQQMVMGRQEQRMESRRPFWLYIDEFQSFITPSMARILSGARKYQLGLILAHQELHHLERNQEVKSALLSNPYTRIVFRVGDADARALEHGFSSFKPKDFQNLERGQAICRVEKADGDFNMSVAAPHDPEPDMAERTRQAVTASSRAKYATPRADVEAMLLARLGSERAEPESPKAKPAPPAAKVSETKPAEIPKATVQDTEKSAVLPREGAPRTEKIPDVQKPPAAVVREPLPPRDLGRGGAQHQAIQKRIKQAAEELGFRGVIEKQYLSGQGSVDLLLERADQAIACEISLTTTIDHEVGNVKKCLEAGFCSVVVICLEEERLQKIAKAVSGSLGPEQARLVEYCTPNRFIARLQSLPLHVPKDLETTVIRRGYKVKRTFVKLTPEEQKRKEDALLRVIAEAMKRDM